MATENSTQQFEHQWNVSSAINDAEQLAIIMQWIEGARHILDVVGITARYHPEFDQLCKKHSIPICNADWDVEQSDALTRLYSLQRKYFDIASNSPKVVQTA